MEAEGFSGGIWLLWNPREVNVEIMAFSDQLIHAVGDQRPCLLTAVYGSPREVERRVGGSTNYQHFA